jgi:hypothetical protein
MVQQKISQRHARTEVNGRESPTKTAIASRIGDESNGPLIVEAKRGADDRMNGQLVSGVDELDDPIEIVGVGESNARMAEKFCAGNERSRAMAPGKERVPAVIVKRNRHGLR